jgi:adenine-specific DNA methylase
MKSSPDPRGARSSDQVKRKMYIGHGQHWRMSLAGKRKPIPIAWDFIAVALVFDKFTDNAN